LFTLLLERENAEITLEPDKILDLNEEVTGKAGFLL
jgi:hypothetical protein